MFSSDKGLQCPCFIMKEKKKSYIRVLETHWQRSESFATKTSSHSSRNNTHIVERDA